MRGAFCCGPAVAPAHEPRCQLRLLWLDDSAREVAQRALPSCSVGVWTADRTTACSPGGVPRPMRIVVCPATAPHTLTPAPGRRVWRARGASRQGHPSRGSPCSVSAHACRVRAPTAAAGASHGISWGGGVHCSGALRGDLLQRAHLYCLLRAANADRHVRIPLAACPLAWPVPGRGFYCGTQPARMTIAVLKRSA